jgi:hypothetical protein
MTAQLIKPTVEWVLYDVWSKLHRAQSLAFCREIRHSRCVLKSSLTRFDGSPEDALAGTIHPHSEHPHAENVLSSSQSSAAHGLKSATNIPYGTVNRAHSGPFCNVKVASVRRTPMNCSVCNQHVVPEMANTDEHGHEKCYVAKLVRGPRVPNFPVYDVHSVGSQAFLQCGGPITTAP